MNHRSSIPIVVAALVVLAGCSALAPSGGSGDNGTTAGGSATTAGSAATATEPTAAGAAGATEGRTQARTATPGSPSMGGGTTGTEAAAASAGTATTAAGDGTRSASGLPPGYAATGVTSPQRAVEGFNSALLAHDSYTLAATVPTTRPTANVSIASRVNATAEREYQVVVGRLSGRQLVRQEEYQNGTAKYTASFPVGINGTPEYNATTQPFAPTTTNSTGGLLGAWLSNATFGRAERVTRNGETLVRYEATGVRNPQPFVSTYASVSNASVEAFNATLLVDREGIVRSFDYSVTYATSRGKQYTTTGILRVGNIDATTVPEPPWLSTAKRRPNASGAGASGGTGAGNGTATGG